MTTFPRTARMTDHSAKCASCESTDNLKQCARCKTVSYCSTMCQKMDWQTHKSVCRFTITVAHPRSHTSTDALSLLLAMSDLEITAQSLTPMTKVAMKVFNIHELHVAIISLLPARELLSVQQVCRSWYITISKERALQERLFFAAGPGRSVLPAREGLLMRYQV